MALPPVAHVEGAHRALRRGADALLAQPRVRARLQVREPALQVRRVGILGAAQYGLHVVGAGVRHQQPERGQHARFRRHDHHRNVQFQRQPSGVQRPGTAERDQREIAQVVATVNRNDPDRPEHVGVGDAHDAERHLHRIHAHFASQPPDGALRRGAVERDAAAERVLGGEPPQYQVGVGYGGLGAAASIAHGSRYGTGAARTHSQDAARVEPGDAAAARADVVESDHRNRERIAAERAARGDFRLPGADQADVGAGTAHVEGHHIHEAGVAGDVSAAEHAADRPRHRRMDAAPARGRAAHHPAHALHHVQRRTESCLPQAPLHVAQVAVQNRHHRGVQHRAADPFVLAVLRQHLRRQAHRQFRVAACAVVGHQPLVRRVGVGVQEAHRHHLHAVAAQFGDRARHARLGQRGQHAAGGVDPLRYAEAQVARHQRRRLVVLGVVQRRLRVARFRDARQPADFQHVAEPLRGEQSHARRPALQDRVERHRATVREAPHRCRRYPRRAGEPAQPVQRAVRRGRRRGRHLGGVRRAPGIVDQYQVGKGAADVIAHAIHVGAIIAFRAR